jgi:uroporphyrinogen decarboxylase
MTSRERVYATLGFQGPDRVPTDLWLLPIVTHGREREVQSLLLRYPTDLHMARYCNPMDAQMPAAPGEYEDGWGSVWHTSQAGHFGEQLRAPLADWSALATYHWPAPAIWEDGCKDAAADIAAHRDRFVLGGWLRPFECMRDLRGAANFYADLAEEREELFLLRDRVFSCYTDYLQPWLSSDVDGIVIADDWGDQRSLLLSPALWRSFLKPRYQELIDLIHGAGKRVFVHSDGWILDLFTDLIEMGVSAVNAQVLLMGLDRLQPYAGRITFWGELDRQHLLPTGTQEEFTAAAQQMINALWRNGGVIGLSEPSYELGLERLEWALQSWQETTPPAATHPHH